MLGHRNLSNVVERVARELERNHSPLQVGCLCAVLRLHLEQSLRVVAELAVAVV